MNYLFLTVAFVSPQYDHPRPRCSVFVVFTLSYWPCLCWLWASSSKDGNLDSSTNASGMISKWIRLWRVCFSFSLLGDSLRVLCLNLLWNLKHWALSCRPNVPVRCRMERFFRVTATDLKTKPLHSRVFYVNRNNTINFRRRNWVRVGMSEWNGMVRLFRFSRTLGQPRKVNPKLRIFFQKMSVPFDSLPGISWFCGRIESAHWFPHYLNSISN